jgi:hypothetical protein
MAVHLFPEEVVPQILSYTTKSRLPQYLLIERFYPYRLLLLCLPDCYLG